MPDARPGTVGFIIAIRRPDGTAPKRSGAFAFAAMFNAEEDAREYLRLLDEQAVRVRLFEVKIQVVRELL